MQLLQVLHADNPATLRARYGLAENLPTGVELLEEIGRRRGCLVRGGRIDYEKAEQIVLTDFRSGRLGRVTLDSPIQAETTDTSSDCIR